MPSSIPHVERVNTVKWRVCVQGGSGRCIVSHAVKPLVAVSPVGKVPGSRCWADFCVDSGTVQASGEWEFITEADDLPVAVQTRGRDQRDSNRAPRLLCSRWGGEWRQSVKLALSGCLGRLGAAATTPRFMNCHCLCLPEQTAAWRASLASADSFSDELSCCWPG